MEGAISVLVVTATTDDGPDTAKLRSLVAELGSHEGVEACLWYLGGPPGSARSGERVVDELRTWPLARTLDRLCLGLVADRLRGLRLRRWVAAIRPDVVVLDDGVGSRVLRRRPAVVVERRTARPSEAAAAEPPSSWTPDLVLVEPGARAICGGPTRRMLWAWEVKDEPPRHLADRQVTRRAFGIDPGGPIVTGWAADVERPGAVEEAIDELIDLAVALSSDGEPARLVSVTDDHDPTVLGTRSDRARAAGLHGRFHQLRTVDAAVALADLVVIPGQPGDPSAAVWDAASWQRPTLLDVELDPTPAPWLVGLGDQPTLEERAIAARSALSVEHVGPLPAPTLAALSASLVEELRGLLRAQGA